MSEWRPHWKDESMSEYSERCCYCGDFYLAYGVVRAVMNGILHTRIRCRYYLASAANSKAPRHGRYPASGGQLWCPACEAPVEECREADEIRRRLAALEGRVDD